MRRIAWLVLLAAGLAQAQIGFVPKPAGVYISSNGTVLGPWDPLSEAVGTDALGFVPEARGLYYSSDGTGNLGTWYPCTLATCFSGGGGGGSGLTGTLGQIYVANGSTTGISTPNPYRVDQFGGSDFCAKVKAALTAANTANGSYKGIYDASGFTSNQSCAASMFPAGYPTSGQAGVVLIMPPVAVTLNAGQAESANDFTILCPSGPGGSGGFYAGASLPSTTALWTFGSTSAISSGIRAEGCRFDNNGHSTYSAVVWNQTQERSGCVNCVFAGNTSSDDTADLVQVVNGDNMRFRANVIQNAAANNGLTFTYNNGYTGGNPQESNLIEGTTCNNTGHTNGLACLYFGTSTNQAWSTTVQTHSEGFVNWINALSGNSITWDGVDGTGTVATTGVVIASGARGMGWGMRDNRASGTITTILSDGNYSLTLAGTSFSFANQTLLPFYADGLYEAAGVLTNVGHVKFEGVTSTGATGTGKFVFDASPTLTGHPTIEGVTSTGATGTGKFVFDTSPTLSGHPTVEGVTSTGATGTGKFVFDNAPTLTGHPTIEGITSTGATGTGKFVFDNAPTLTGHPTVEGVTSTGATGTGKFVFDTSPTLSGHPTVEGVTSTGATGTGKFVYDTSPTLGTPTLTSASLSGASTVVPSGATLTIQSGGTFACAAGSNCPSNAGDAITSPNSTLSVGGTGTATTLDVNLSHANTWAALQTFGSNASIGGTAHGVIVSENTAGTGVTGTGSSGQPLLSAGSSADPAYGTLGIGGGGTGATTQGAALINILPVATRAGDILYCATYSGTCTSWALLAGNNSGSNFLQENSSGVPSWAAGGGGDSITSPNSTISVGGTSSASTLDVVGGAGQILAGSTPALSYTPTLGVANSHAGSLTTANGSANASTTWGSGATTSNTINGFATAPTTGHLIDCTVTSTTCLLHDTGVTTSQVVTSAASLTSTAFMTGAGSQGSQTPSATSVLDSSGNATFVGSVSSPVLKATGTTPGAASLVAGSGNIPALTANSAGFAAPATGGTAYLFKLPATITAGILHAAAPATADNVNESALTSSAVNLAADVTGQLPISAVGSSGLSGTAPVAISSAGAISLSGAAGQIPNGSTGAFTATPSLGTDNSVAGTLQLANGSSNAHTIWSSGATTTNTIQGFATAPTTGHMVDCTVTSTTCLLHDSGVVTANVVNASSPGAGIARFAGSTQTVTSAELSGDATTSGSNAVTVAKINGGTVGASWAFPVTNGSSQLVQGVGAITFTLGDVTNSSALTTSELAYFTVPRACTISGYDLMIDAGTITVKFLKVATGTAIPTLGSNSISTSGVSISSGTAIHSTTTSDFTTTTVSAFDIMGVAITSVSTAKYLTAQVECK